MKQTDIDLSNAIARGVSKALKETSITVITKEAKTEPIDIISCARVIKNYCTIHTCAECKLKDVDGSCIVNETPNCWCV